jgi:hypothetical protein
LALQQIRELVYGVQMDWFGKAALRQPKKTNDLVAAAAMVAWTSEWPTIVQCEQVKTFGLRDAA